MRSWRSTRFRLLAACAGLLLAGCAELTATAPPPATPVAESPPPPTVEPRTEERVALVPPPPRPKPPVPRPAEPAAVRPVESTAPVEPPAEATTPARVRLVGMSQAETLALLGQPSSEGASGAARVWQYAAPSCRLEVEFFLDVSRNAFFALNYAAAGNATPEANDRCLQDVVDDRRKNR